MEGHIKRCRWRSARKRKLSTFVIKDNFAARNTRKAKAAKIDIKAKKQERVKTSFLLFLFSLKLLGELIQGGAPFCQASIFFGLVEIVSIEKFGKGYAGALAKALHSNDLGAFCSALENIVNRRGRHPAA